MEVLERPGILKQSQNAFVRNISSVLMERKYYLEYLGSWDHGRQACLRAHGKAAEKPRWFSTWSKCHGHWPILPLQSSIRRWNPLSCWQLTNLPLSETHQGTRETAKLIAEFFKSDHAQERSLHAVSWMVSPRPPKSYVWDYKPD